MFNTVLLHYFFLPINLKKKGSIFMLSGLKMSCSVIQAAALGEDRFLVSLLQTDTRRAARPGHTTSLSHIPSTSQAPSSQGIINLVAFLKVFSLCVLFPSLIFFFCPPSVLLSVQCRRYFTGLAVDNFSLWNSLSFKFNFLIVSWERKTVTGLRFIIYILGGKNQLHSERRDSFRNQVQANTW